MPGEEIKQKDQCPQHKDHQEVPFPPTRKQRTFIIHALFFCRPHPSYQNAHHYPDDQSKGKSFNE